MNGSFTSKNCLNCEKQCLENIIINSNKIHEVLNCKNCNILFDRDIVCSKNIFYLAYLQIIVSNGPKQFNLIQCFKHFMIENIFGYNM
ncbi:unnamed protein product [Cunninghamella blakesleeana]